MVQVREVGYEPPLRRMLASKQRVKSRKQKKRDRIKAEETDKQLKIESNQVRDIM